MVEDVAGVVDGDWLSTVSRRQVRWAWFLWSIFSEPSLYFSNRRLKYKKELSTELRAYSERIKFHLARGVSSPEAHGPVGRAQIKFKLIERQSTFATACGVIP